MFDGHNPRWHDSLTPRIVAGPPAFRNEQRAGKETSQFVFHLKVITSCERLPCKQPCQRIGCIHVSGAAECVAWKLVQQKQQCQCPLRCRYPFIAFAPGCGEVEDQELPTEMRVECRILREPVSWSAYARSSVLQLFPFAYRSSTAPPQGLALVVIDEV